MPPAGIHAAMEPRPAAGNLRASDSPATYGALLWLIDWLIEEVDTLCRRYAHMRQPPKLRPSVNREKLTEHLFNDKSID